MKLRKKAGKKHLNTEIINGGFVNQLQTLQNLYAKKSVSSVLEMHKDVWCTSLAAGI